MRTQKSLAAEVFGLILDGNLVDEQRAIVLLRKLTPLELTELAQDCLKVHKLIEQLQLISTFRLSKPNKVSQLDTET